MTPNNFREKANLIWQAADDTLCVRGAFKVRKNGDMLLSLIPLHLMPLLYVSFSSFILIVAVSACNYGGKPLRSGAQSQYESTDTPIPIQSPAVNIPAEGTIAFTANDEIYTMEVNGSTIKRITRTVDYASAPDWSPDGKQIVYATGDGIFVTNSTGTEHTQLTKYSSEVGYAHDPKWSPDGRRIIFFRNCKLFIINHDGSEEREFTYENRPPNWCDWTPDWSPDGNRIVFSGITMDKDSFHTINMDLYIVNVDGSGLRQLTQNFFTENVPTFMPNGAMSSTFASEDSPAWSPAGELIAFSMDMAPEDLHSHIYIMKADGSEEPQRLIHQSSLISERAPDWSVDGQWLVFSAEDEDRASGIWIVKVDGTGLRRLGKVSDNDEDPSWYSAH